MKGNGPGRPVRERLFRAGLFGQQTVNHVLSESVNHVLSFDILTGEGWGEGDLIKEEKREAPAK